MTELAREEAEAEAEEEEEEEKIEEEVFNPRTPRIRIPQSERKEPKIFTSSRVREKTEKKEFFSWSRMYLQKKISPVALVGTLFGDQ